MADRVLVNLATGLEDGERVTVAFVVAGAGLERGREVAMFLTKEAVRLAVPGHAEGVACENFTAKTAPGGSDPDVGVLGEEGETVFSVVGQPPLESSGCT